MSYPPYPPEPPPLPYPEQGGWPAGGYPGYPPAGPPPYLDGTGGYGPAPQRPHGTTTLIVTAIVVLVAALVFVGVLVWSSRSDTDTTAASTTTTAAPRTPVPPAVPAPITPTTTTTTTTSSAPLSSTCNESATGPGPATPPGWSTVTSPRQVVYDVPSEWRVLSCSTLVGWEKECDDGPFGYCPIRMMSGAAELEDDRCDSASHAVTGVPGAADASDIDDAVRRETTLVADIYTEGDVVPTVALSEPRHFTIGATPAVRIDATVTGIGPGECSDSPSARHVMVATTVPGETGPVMFVAAIMQGGEGDPDPGLGEQLVSTLRFAE
ncbi:hypothetical protein H7J77_10565 [Mycolicibacillus parakoreensis]|uniref:DUF8017 domain-containing protein n=1 Tax=Mycolicibacillus parakoreensis TaxID=1069221 RepID=A0ABY3U4P9_9MYCO|nr:hypothetical protein [Mycolicibacillus parakoreensis]MCV7315981.1 hypothetical protein [Mycolicibacillus parakoreensis]ULN52389.1 hypothetical protein MIU77_16350 [Mycolicibacillus parakoreensis]